jgi:hypothetical protein
VLKAQYTKGEWGRLRRFPMKRVLKGNGEHTKIQQKRKFPMKRVLKEQNGTNQALTFRKFLMKGVLKAASTTTIPVP